ncbi:hypothetical protein BVX94_01890 [bacterium B17]|nr:hypothetical protein BVX94_01890 [bacterium B17]
MQKYRYIWLYLICGTILLGSGISTQAQHFNEDEGLEFERTKVLSSKKRPGFMHRPKKPTPAEQLTYADSLRKNDKLKKAAKQYSNLVRHWHEAPEAPQAQYSYADVLHERGKYFKSFREYQYLMDHFPGRFSYDEVLKKQYKVANHIMTSRRYKFLFFPGFSTPDIAVDFFEKIVKNAPTWENAPKAQFNIGLIQEERKRYETAARAYGIVQSRYRDSEYAATAFFRKAYCLYKASRSKPRDEKRARNALSTLSAYTQRYHSDPNVKEVHAMMAQIKEDLAKMYYDRAYFYDKMKTKPLAAMIMYEDFVKKFPSSELTPMVNERIAELKQATAFMENEENESIQ